MSQHQMGLYLRLLLGLPIPALLQYSSVCRAFMENLIFTEGATLGGTFAGDTFITGYWGVAINLNNGGFSTVLLMELVEVIMHGHMNLDIVLLR